MKEYRRRYREKHGLPPEKDTPSWKKRAAVVLALCVIGFGGFFAAQSKAEQMVTLNGQSIADMTDEEIRAKDAIVNGDSSVEYSA